VVVIECWRLNPRTCSSVTSTQRGNTERTLLAPSLSMFAFRTVSFLRSLQAYNFGVEGRHDGSLFNRTGEVQRPGGT
jgi:hypothetical protein